jgi:CHRD domain
MKLAIWMAITGVLTMVPVALARDDDHRDKDKKFATKLSGYNEVHFSGGGGEMLPVPAAALRGAVSTKASGKFEATIHEHMKMIDYKLSYEGLEGDVTQGHIHFGQRHTVGGIVVWLCQTKGTQAPEEVRALTPFCPPEGKVEGTITPEQVLEQALQGFKAGEFDELVRAIRAGATYANVHTTLHTPGEIRGQIKKDDIDRKK